MNGKSYSKIKQSQVQIGFFSKHTYVGTCTYHHLENTHCKVMLLLWELVNEAEIKHTTEHAKSCVCGEAVLCSSIFLTTKRLMNACVH